jgi:hypothetical protein
LVGNYTCGAIAADQPEIPACTEANQPHAVGRPVTTTTIKRCPEGYELIIRANGQPGWAKDIVPTYEEEAELIVPAITLYAVLVWFLWGFGV